MEQVVVEPKLEPAAEAPAEPATADPKVCWWSYRAGTAGEGCLMSSSEGTAVLLSCASCPRPPQTWLHLCQTHTSPPASLQTGLATAELDAATSWAPVRQVCQLHWPLLDNSLVPTHMTGACLIHPDPTQAPCGMNPGQVRFFGTVQWLHGLQPCNVNRHSHSAEACYSSAAC
jgi:hypothetical protein